MMGMDVDYAVSRSYRAGGWPTFVVVDPQGIIRFHGFDSDRDLGGVRKCLDELLKANPADAKRLAMSQGIAYLPDVRAAREARRDRAPRLGFDAAGNPLIVFCSNRTGTNSVYLRRYDQHGRQTSEQLLSAAGVESYAPDCVRDGSGALWVAWCARPDRSYDIFVQCLREGKEPATEQLTHSDDDAMAPRLTAGPVSGVTATYYKWAKMRGVSRDRNIFARRYDPARRAWNAEQEVSPHQPEVEDHTDPAVVVDRQGTPWVIWSFDYHPQLYSQPAPAGQPTIFASRVDSNSVSAPMLVGASDPYRWAIDLFPSAAFDRRGTLWCAWDCSEPRRCVRLARLDAASNSFKQAAVFGRQGEICSTPELSPADEDRLLLAWSQRRAAGPWRGKVLLLQQGRSVSEAMLDEDSDVLFPQAQADPKGERWVVYEKAAPSGSQIVLRNLTEALATEGR